MPIRDGRIAVVVDRFPCITETFVASEVEALGRRGLLSCVVSCSPPDRCDVWPGERGPLVDYCVRPTPKRVFVHLLSRLARKPLESLSLSVSACRSVPRSWQGLWWAISCLYLADKLVPRLREQQICHLHAQFLHRPALITKLLARILRLPYSLSAHARDVYVTEFRPRALCREARFVMVCSSHAARVLQERLGARLADKVALSYHGIDLRRFSVPVARPASDDGTLRLLSVGRLVSKKGIDIGLRAVSILEKRGVPVIYRIIGDGPQQQALGELCQQLNLPNVEWLPLQEQARLIDHYSWADALIFPGRVATDGDTDGVPNVILEAMALGLPVIAADAGGVSEVIRYMQTGWLVPQESPESVVNAIDQVRTDKDLVTELSQRARDLVESRFDLEIREAELVDRFERLLGNG